ncbi:MAG TPA: dTMP kinase, partial [Micromonosporaceae bacterium]|nr:dTMP kinase [Micromonosporaceae bacterium]
TGGLKPHLVILMDIDPKVGLARAGMRGLPDRLEQESIDFHERVRLGFQELAAKEPSRYLVLDATRDEKELAEEIAAKVAALLPPLAKTEEPEPERAERVRTPALS